MKESNRNKKLTISVTGTAGGSKKPKPALTKKEIEIMTALWDAGQALSSSEICSYAVSQGVTLNPSTVKMTVKKLLGEGYLRVGGITQVDVNHVLARTFEPTLSADDYAVLRINDVLDKTEKPKMLGLFTALLQHENVDRDTLDQLEAVIEELKQK